jgi:DNA-binding transcriptional MerR regulator
MSHDFKMTMKDLCLLMGVSQQAIRMYEKKGAMPQAKNEINGYRYYHYPDLQQGVHLRNYIRTGISIQQAAAMINGAPLDDIGKILESQRKEIEKQIAWKQALIRALDRQQQWYRDIPLLHDQMEKCWYNIIPCGKIWMPILNLLIRRHKPATVSSWLRN